MRPTPGNARFAVASTYLIVDGLAHGRELDHLLTTLGNARGGYPESTIPEALASGGSPADPTLRLVLHPDEATRDLQALHEAIDAMAQWAAEVHRIHRRWRPDEGKSRLCRNTQNCPDGALRAIGRSRCDACARHLQRHGHERTKVAELRSDPPPPPPFPVEGMAL